MHDQSPTTYYARGPGCYQEPSARSNKATSPACCQHRQSPCLWSCKLTATSVGGGTPLVTLWLMSIRMDSGHNVHSTPTATCSEQRQPLYVAFIDLTRAFDTADRQALWSILSRHCYYEKYMRILRLVPAGMSVPRCSATAALTLAFHGENGARTAMHYPRRAQSSKPRANLGTPSSWCLTTMPSQHTSQNTSRAY